MHLNSTDHIIRTADRLLHRTGSCDPEIIAEELNIRIYDVPFQKQKGVYKILKRNRCIFVKENLEEPMCQIVLLFLETMTRSASHWPSSLRLSTSSEHSSMLRSRILLLSLLFSFWRERLSFSGRAMFPILRSPSLHRKVKQNDIYVANRLA